MNEAHVSEPGLIVIESFRGSDTCPLAFPYACTKQS